MKSVPDRFPEITAIRSRKSGGRVQVYVDGELAFVCNREFVLRECLAEGDRIPPERLQELQSAAEVDRAREAALRLLSVRSRTEAEMTRRLEEKGYGPDVTATVVDSLKQSGFLDDARHAEAFVLERMRRRPMGRRRLLSELRAHGVPPAVIREVLDEHLPEELEPELALRALRQRHPDGLPDDPAAQRRLIAYLQRRGFGYETIQEAMSRRRCEQV